MVRNEIQDFASTRTIFSNKFKLIILDECDAMTKDAQFALRRGACVQAAVAIKTATSRDSAARAVDAVVAVGDSDCHQNRPAAQLALKCAVPRALPPPPPVLQ